MNRVKMNAKHEYEFLANFKVLQNVFKAKRIDKVRAKTPPSPLYFSIVIQIRGLTHLCSPCRWRNSSNARCSTYHSSYDATPPLPDLLAITRDNLEFLQWIKRFWESNYGGHGYDAVARRKGAALEPPATVAPVPTSRSTPGAAGGSRAGGRTPLGGFRSGSAQSNEQVIQLQNQVAELNGQLEGLEKERDFYFEKVCTVCSRYRWLSY